MEPLAPIPIPAAADAAADAALTEVEIAVALVAGGSAVRVRVAGMTPDIGDAIAGLAAARAGAAGVAFRLERSGSGVTFTVGPRG
jgi:hypothetical protein